MNDFPNHLPVDMAVAPQKSPYDTPHTVPAGETQASSLAQHSLSPEKLGVTGYVRDVAGFVKDAVHEAHDKRQNRQRETSAVVEPPRTDAKAIQTADSRSDTSSPKNSPETRARSPLAEAVTSLFPHVLDTNTQGCVHADDLRMNMMMQSHHSDDFDRNDALLHKTLKD